MLYVVQYQDAPAAEAQRQAHRPAHIAFRKGLGAALQLAGPLLNDDGASIGSLILLEAADPAAAGEIAAQDPYVAAGVFASFGITAFKLAYINLPARDA